MLEFMVDTGPIAMVVLIALVVIGATRQASKLRKIHNWRNDMETLELLPYLDYRKPGHEITHPRNATGLTLLKWHAIGGTHTAFKSIRRIEQPARPDLSSVDTEA